MISIPPGPISRETAATLERVLNDLLKQIQISAEAPLRAIQSPQGLSLGIELPDEPFLAELTAESTGSYAWIEKSYTAAGAYTDKPGGRTGEVDLNPAVELSGLEGVPTGTIVELRRTGYYDDTTGWRYTFSCPALSASTTSGHTIQEEGTPLTQRENLNFVGNAITASDDAGNDATLVTLSQVPSGSTSVVGTTANIICTSPLSNSRNDLAGNPTLSITGLSTIGTANYLPGVNSGATGWEYKAIGSGNNVTVTHSPGVISIASKGYSTIEDNGAGLSQRNTLNIIGNAFTISDSGGKTNLTLDQIPSGSQSVVGTTANIVCTAPLLNSRSDFAGNPTLSIGGLNGYGTANYFVGTNPDGTALQYKSVLAGSGIQITHNDGATYITNTRTAAHVIQEEGVNLSQRTKLNFIGGAITASDDSVNDTTHVTLYASPNSSTVVGTGRTITTSGSALSGGGDLSDNRTIALSASPDSASVVGIGRTLTTTSPLQIDGGASADLSAGRTFSIGGLSGLGTANYVVGVNVTGTAWEYKIITGGAGITVTPTAGTITITATGTGHVIQDEGLPLTQRANLNFSGGAVTVTDDSGNNATKVTLSASPNSASVVGIGRTLAATSPLRIDGGGSADLSANRTLSVTVSPDPSTTLLGTGRTISTTFPVMGGGDLTDDRTFYLDTATGLAGNKIYGLNAANDRGEYKTVTGNSPITITHTAGDIAIGMTGSAGHIIQSYGTDQTQRARLNFKQNLIAIDDAANGCTYVHAVVSPVGATNLVGTTREINTTAPLSGGGDLSQTRTLSIAVSPDPSATVVGTGRAVTTTAPLRIDGGASADLSGDRTLTLQGLSGYGGVRKVVACNLGNNGLEYITLEAGTNMTITQAVGKVTFDVTDTGAYVPTTRTLTTTSPLRIDGGASANLSGDRTLSVGGMSGLGTANYVIGVNSDGTAWEAKQIIGGTNVTISHSAGGVTINAAGASGYTTIQEESSNLTQRTKLAFIGGALTATDDAGNSRTKVTLSATPDSSSVVGTGRNIQCSYPLSNNRSDLASDPVLSIPGLSTIGTANYLPGVNSGATGWEYKQLVAGTNMTSIVHGSGTITFNAATQGGGGGTPHGENAYCQLGLTGTVNDITNVSGGTTVYLNPCDGDLIDLYASGSWATYDFGGASVSKSLSGTGANTNYDVFVYWTGAALQLELLAWTNDTTPVSRGSVSGVLVRGSDSSRRYVGSIRTKSAGQCDDNPEFRYCFSYYNQRLKNLVKTDGTGSWTCNVTSFRAWNNNSSNKVNFLIGVQTEPLNITFTSAAYSNASQGSRLGLGLDSTTTPATDSTTPIIGGGGLDYLQSSVAIYNGYPGVGVHYLCALEFGSAAFPITFYGSGSNYNYGIRGWIKC